MLFKEAGSFTTKARWIAGMSAAALLAVGVVVARQGFRTSQPAFAPARSAPARTRPLVPQEQSRIAANFGNLPLSFEPNRGQTDEQVKFLSRNSHYDLFLTSDEAVFTLPVRSSDENTNHSGMRKKTAKIESEAVLRLQIHGASSSTKVSGDSMLAGHTNYLIGRDSSKWVKDIPQYARVKYQDVYPGVDLTFYGQQRQLEFDFIVKPGGDPSAISLGIEGAKKIAMHKTGDLVLSSAPGDLLLHKPVAYQKAGNTRQPIDAQFVLKGTEVALSVGPYDHQRELVIDPAIGYGTYLGSGGEDIGSAIAVDSSGATYITGQTASTGFPLKNPLSTNSALQGASDAFVTKLSADGTALVYSTFLGGTDVDSGNAIAVDNVTGQAYIAGGTKSHDFPMAGSSAQNTPGGSGTFDAFVAVLSATGNSLVYSTYVGGAGDDVANGIAIDSTGIYITGTTSSTNFPPVNALQLTLSGTGTTDAFVTKLKALPAGSFTYSSYLGGTDNDGGTGIAVDPSSNMYVTGFTSSTTFPNATTNSNAGGQDAFVAEIKADFSQYVYFSFLGGSGKDIGDQIAVDGSGNAYIAGQTGSSNFPTNGTNAAFQTTLATGSSQNAFLTVVKPGGTSYLYSTYLGGKGLDTALALALDSATPPKVYLTGQTTSSNFPTTTNATQPQIGGMTDAFVSILNPNVAGTGSLIFSTYLGGSADEDDLLAGIAVDPSGNFYVTGDTQSSTNISTPGSFEPTFSGGTGCTGTGIICRDAFVVKYLPNAPQFKVSIGAVSPSSISRGSNGTATVTVTSTGASGTVTLGCAIQGTATTPPTCSVNPTSGTLAANGTVTTTLTITTVKSGAISVTGAALWLPIPGLALFGIGFLRNKKSNRRVLWSLLCTFALTGILLMMGCGNGNGGSTGGGGGGGTTTGSYTATVTAAIASTGSQSGSAQFNVQ